MTRTNKDMNAAPVLARVQACIAELEEMGTALTTRTLDWDRYDWKHANYGTGKSRYVFKMDAVYEELSIFDWWNDTLSLTQLKEMEKFLKTAIKMGYTGYVCFKVGAAGCSNGMWASKQETTDGYSPDGATLYRGFVTGGYNEWDACLDDGTWFHDIVDEKSVFTLTEVKNMLKGVQA